MRHLLITLISMPLVLQAQMSKDKTSTFFQSALLNDQTLEIDSFGFNGSKYLDTLFYENKQIKSIGYYAIDKKGKKTYHRVGLWTEYYRNGQKLSIGNYDLQFYYGCYNTIPEIRYYSFKKGDWIYFYENGQTKAKGTYKLERIEKSTGVAFQFETKSTITGNWLIYDSDGQTAKEREKIISSLDRLTL